MVAATSRMLRADAVPGWLAELSSRMAVYAPLRREGQVSFGLYKPGAEIDLVNESVTPPKQAVFPQTKVLMRFDQSVDPEAPEQRKLVIEEDIDASPALVFGARPCGVQGFLTFDPVFGNQAVVDPYYQARRANTTFVTLACEAPRRSCFCNLVGGAPDDARGSDVLLVPVEGGFAATALTEKGQALVAAAPFEDAPGIEAKAQAVCQKARESMGAPRDISQIAPALEKLFTNLDFWDGMAAGCVSCGACTYLCPTCYCFNITDESDGQTGARVRTWDSCMFAQYTLEASGHNPRPTKAHRLRNRIGHKFWYHPKRNAGFIACCGCGRCTRHCPGGVDLRHIIEEALKLHEG